MGFFTLPRSGITVAGPTIGDATLLFSNGTLLCVDTSSLLEALRMSKVDADLFLDNLESMKQRLVIPPTAAGEVRSLGLAKVEEAIRIETASTRNTGRSLGKRPQGAGAEHHDEYTSALIALTEEFRKRVRSDIERRFHRILALIGDCIGPELPLPERRRVVADAPNRYLRRQPPGYADSGKAARGGAAYGDILIFFEMIHVARVRGANVGFVTTDSKEDWWEIDPSVMPRRLLRGRRELLQEFRAESGRTFAIFHGLRLVSDLTEMSLLFSQMGSALAQWETRTTLWTHSNLPQIYDAFGAQIRSLRRFASGFDPAPLNIGMGRYHQMIQEMRRGIFEAGLNLGMTPASRVILPPTIIQVVNKSVFKTLNFPVPDIARILGLGSLSTTIAVASRSAWHSMKLGLQISNSPRLFRDMTFNLPTFAPRYLKKFEALIEDVRNLPSVHPAVKLLGDLSRPTMPERRRGASALRRMYSHRRRKLRRLLRGKRINLLDENLPLERILVPRQRD